VPRAPVHWNGNTLYSIKRKKYITPCAELAFARMVMIFLYRICYFFFICYAVGLLQYSRSVWSKTPLTSIMLLFFVFFKYSDSQYCFKLNGLSLSMYIKFVKLAEFDDCYKNVLLRSIFKSGSTCILVYKNKQLKLRNF
jgi:hypothetical protein